MVFTRFPFSRTNALLLLLVFAVTACQGPEASEASAQQSNTSTESSVVLAGGCFWCVESDFEKLDGVGDAISGYAGGSSQSPTYENHADHLEVVRVPYNADTVSYRKLVDYFLRHIDPLDADGQFCDRGHSYTTAIFYASDAEKAAALAAIEQAEEVLGKKVVTRVLALDQFWRAEEYHQDYYKKNPIRYRYYRNGCGRDRRVADVWGKQ